MSMTTKCPDFESTFEAIRYWGSRTVEAEFDIPWLNAKTIRELQEEAAGVPMSDPTFRERMLAYEDKRFGIPKKQWLHLDRNYESATLARENGL